MNKKTDEAIVRIYQEYEERKRQRKKNFGELFMLEGPLKVKKRVNIWNIAKNFRNLLIG